ncbi:hypothetical protein [Candidatus Bodocaedibacter vickermanii]|uniref:Uncharacterized protein n=1 Tax=Candidatus Bodocaedibacter vickermanii TaxID=2741701 RepID=A0A7L9RUX6_9PROT|nr:hypothetical protein CPBP_01158 [Candidatus Paracaedibacteraceae bacterium 'Lake Konstanz']
MVVQLVKEFINITRETYRNEEKNAPFDTQTVLVCILGAVSLLLIQFIAKTGKFIYFLRELNLYSASDYFKLFFLPSENGNLVQLAWFASFSFFSI